MRGHRSADALRTAQSCAVLARGTNDPGAIAMTEWMLGHAKNYAGRFVEARRHLVRYFDLDTETSRQAAISSTGYDRRADALTSLAHTLRALGEHDEAKRRGEQAIAEARSLGLAVPIVVATASVLTNTYLVEPDIDLIEQHATEVVELARAHSIHSDLGYGLSVLAVCQARRGDFEAGERQLAEGLSTLHKEILEALLRGHFCEAAIEAGRLDKTFQWMPALEPSEQNKEHWCSAEILRIQGILAAAQGRDHAAEIHFLEAMNLARRQSALFWELRAMMSFSQLLAAGDRQAEAFSGLSAVYGRFPVGRSADLLKAKRLIGDLAGFS